MMYEVGQLVQYGGAGVCEVQEIKPQVFPDKGERLYYVLRPLYKACVISVPVESDKVFLRPIITREEAEHLIGLIPTLDCPPPAGRPGRELAERYGAILKSHDCRDWMELAVALRAKKKRQQQLKRKLGSVDERYLKQAEELLFGEFAAALEITREEVPGAIAALLETRASA